MTLTKSGAFGWAGGGKAGATVDAWLASRFAEAPSEGTLPPSGAPDAGPVTTGTEYGSPGAYMLTMPSVADYYIRIQYGGVTYWGACPAGTIQGNTETPGEELLIANNLSDVESNIASYLNLMIPGADPTGTLDSTAEIQAAINNSFNGLSVMLPPGIFLIGTEGVGLVGNFVYGMGPGPTILREATGFTGNAIQSATYGSTTATLDKNGFQVSGIIIDTVAHPYTSPGTNTAATPLIGFTTSVISGNSVNIGPGQNTGTGFQAWMAAATIANPVYAWFADQLCTFTGGTGTVGGTGTLTGIVPILTGGGWSLPTYAGCEVKQYGSTGHGIATCAKKPWIDDVWITSVGGSGIYLEPGANATTSPQGAQFHNGRIENAGRFGIELGPQVSDVMVSTWSILSISDGFAGLLSSGNGDIHIYDFHPTGNNNGLNPAVIVSSSSTQIDKLTVDTLTGAPVVLDNTGRWSVPGTIKDFQLSNVNFTNPTGALAAFPSPVVSYKARTTNSVVRGGIDKVSASTGWKYGIANGPFCTLGPAVTATGTFGKITVDSPREFNPLGGSAQFQNTPGTEACDFTYTGIDYTAVQATPAQTLHAAGGTLILNAIKFTGGNSNSPGLTLTADSLFVATPTGLVELAYTSISGTTVTYPAGGWKGSDGYVVPNNAIVFQGHLLGCAYVSGSTTAINDGALIVETGWNNGNIGYQSGTESSATTFSIGDIKTLNLLAAVFSQNSNDIYNYTTSGAGTPGGDLGGSSVGSAVVDQSSATQFQILNALGVNVRGITSNTGNTVLSTDTVLVCSTTCTAITGPTSMTAGQVIWIVNAYAINSGNNVVFTAGSGTSVPDGPITIPPGRALGLLATSSTQWRHIVAPPATGFGVQTAPSTSTSGTAVTNPFNFPVTVYYTGGTVTATSVNGTAVGNPQSVRVPANGTITPTYSGTLTWQWVGD